MHKGLLFLEAVLIRLSVVVTASKSKVRTVRSLFRTRITFEVTKISYRELEATRFLIGCICIMNQVFRVWF